ncbi:hypothetical protein D3C86_1925380 [compost metagenome]
MDFFVTLAGIVRDHGLALARVFELHAFGKELAFILAEINLKNVVIGLLTQAIAIDIFRLIDS